MSTNLSNNAQSLKPARAGEHNRQYPEAGARAGRGRRFGDQLAVSIETVTQPREGVIRKMTIAEKVDDMRVRYWS